MMESLCENGERKEKHLACPEASIKTRTSYINVIEAVDNVKGVALLPAGALFGAREGLVLVDGHGRLAG
jgi:hypothetical protein